jgi:predicted XRE-type DNA-binding protein
MKPIDNIPVMEGSGNVFADLDLPNADDLQTKAELTRQIYQRIGALGLSQTKAAKVLGLKQPDVSRLMNGRFTGFSVERLLELLNALAVDVDIVLRPGSTRGGRRGAVQVLTASRRSRSRTDPVGVK